MAPIGASSPAETVAGGSSRQPAIKTQVQMAAMGRIMVRMDGCVVVCMIFLPSFEQNRGGYSRRTVIAKKRRSRMGTLLVTSTLFRDASRDARNTMSRDCVDDSASFSDVALSSTRQTFHATRHATQFGQLRRAGQWRAR
jgi:hypothetical protein